MAQFMFQPRNPSQKVCILQSVALRLTEGDPRSIQGINVVLWNCDRTSLTKLRLVEGILRYAEGSAWLTEVFGLLSRRATEGLTELWLAEGGGSSVD